MKSGRSPYEPFLTKMRGLSEVLSPGEIDILKASGENRVNAEIARLKNESEQLPLLRAETQRLGTEIEKRKFGLKTLAAHQRAKLSNRVLTKFCRVQTLQNGITHICWPTGDYLEGIGQCVIDYLRFTRERVKPPRPLWKAFRLVDRRIPSVQLCAQVDQLADWAEKRLKEDKTRTPHARPLILWLWSIGHPSARKLLLWDPIARAFVKVAQKHARKETAASRREAWRERQARHRIGVTA